MKASEQIDEFLKLAEKASDGRWHVVGNTLYLRDVSRENPGKEHLDYHVFPGNQTDIQFIAQSRNLGPKMAMALQLAINALDLFQHQGCDGPEQNGCKACYSKKKLAEIDSIFNPKDEG